MHGLDEYDSEARWYYPAIMRTTTMDPLCEKYYDISPYAWCNNNPINYVDPDGRDWYESNVDGKLCYKYNEHILSQTDLDNLGINGKYIGATFEDNGVYHGLWGSYQKKGTLEYNLVKKIDAFLTAYAKYMIEDKNYCSSYESEGVIEPKLNFNNINNGLNQSEIIEYGDFKNFNYAGGKATYLHVKNSKTHLESWPNSKTKMSGYGGYMSSNVKIGYFMIFSNTGKSKNGYPLIIQFANDNFYERFKNQFFR